VSHATLRFYGRFVVAEPVEKARTGTVSFLAPNMTTSPIPERRFVEHQVLLTAPRAAIDRKRTTIEPSTRAMSDVRASFAELFVWRFLAADITIEGQSPFTLQREATLVELSEPVGSIHYPPQIDRSGLSASLDGLTMAAVHLNTGRARAFASSKNKYNFVTESDARDGDPLNDRFLGTDGGLADAIEVAIAADAEGLVRLGVRTAEGKQGEICVDTKNFAPTLSLSNLCAGLPQDVLYDLEFARYYDYIQNSPTDAPIPAVVPRAAGPEDCNQFCHFSYE
jgi:hypothetical protein